MAESFGFRAVEASALDARTRELLFSWGLGDASALAVVKFQFTKRFAMAQRDAFLAELLSLPEAQALFESLDAAEARFSELAATATSLSLFDPLLGAEDVLAPSGRIRRCAEVDVSGKVLGDNLQRAMLDAGCEHHALLGAGARREVLCKLLEALVGGNGMCQPSERFEDYAHASRALYRAMVGAVKARDTEEIRVVSDAFEMEDAGRFLPKAARNPLSTCIVAVDRRRKTATLLRKAYYPWS